MQYSEFADLLCGIIEHPSCESNVRFLSETTSYKKFSAKGKKYTYSAFCPEGSFTYFNPIFVYVMQGNSIILKAKCIDYMVEGYGEVDFTEDLLTDDSWGVMLDQ